MSEHHEHEQKPPFQIPRPLAYVAAFLGAIMGIYAAADFMGYPLPRPASNFELDEVRVAGAQTASSFWYSQLLQNLSEQEKYRQKDQAVPLVLKEEEMEIRRKLKSAREQAGKRRRS